MKRTFALIFSILFILLIGLVINYQLKYSIDDSKDNIENKIVIFLNKSKYQLNENKINIVKECNIGTSKYVLFILNNKLAYAELRKGINSKYKIISVTAYINMIRYEIVKTNKSKYLFVFGKNADLKIDYIKAKVSVDEYKVTIPKELYFISYCPVSPEASLGEDPHAVKIINQKGNDISKEITSD